MAKKPHKYTRKLQFDKKTQEKIIERDHGACIFCEMGYGTEGSTWFATAARDIMHFVPKSQMGLGIEQNGALGCRYHHHLLDNGNRGLRDEMIDKFDIYLSIIYPDWDIENLLYKKYGF